MKGDDIRVFIASQLGEITGIISLSNEHIKPQGSMDHIQSERFESGSKVSNKLSVIINYLYAKKQQLKEAKDRYEEHFVGILQMIQDYGSQGLLTCVLPCGTTIKRRGSEFSFLSSKDGFSITFNSKKIGKRVILFFFKRVFEAGVNLNLKHVYGLCPMIGLLHLLPSVYRGHGFYGAFKNEKNETITLYFQCSSHIIKSIGSKLNNHSINVRKYSEDFLVPIRSRVPDGLLHNKQEVLDFLEEKYLV